MTLTQAKALLDHPDHLDLPDHPDLPDHWPDQWGGPIIQEHDPQSDEVALVALASWAHRFTPRVAVDPPDGLLLDITEARLAHDPAHDRFEELEWFRVVFRIEAILVIVMFSSAISYLNLMQILNQSCKNFLLFSFLVKKYSGP